MKKQALTIILCAAALLLTAPSAFSEEQTNEKPEQVAQNSAKNVQSSTYVDIIPAPSVKNKEYPTEISEPTHPPIKLSPDKSELIELDQSVATVIAGNPNHLAIVPGTSQSLVLVGRMPGATHFIALNKDGEVIMQRHVLVAAPKENYVRVRRTCAALDNPDGCQNTQMYYCPDTCHEIIINPTGEQSGGSGNAEGAEQAVSGGGDGEEQSDE